MSHSHVVKHAKSGSRQTHMNREKFNPYRHKDENQRLDQSILDTMTSFCCKRCCDIIQWKVDFGKYICLDRPRKCNLCSEKRVAIAYHHICQECAKENIRCAKCQKPPPRFDVAGGEAQSRDDDVTESDEETNRQAEGNPAGASSESVLAQYLFVNELDSDEEFHSLRGLDIRRLKQYKKRLTALREKEERDQLRERERRTVLRKLKKEGKDANEGAEIDSDEEL